DVIVRRTHAFSAAARDGFDHHGVADFFRNLERFLFALNDAVAAGRNRDAGISRGLTRDVFVAHRADGAGGRADEFDVAARADFREVRVLREKTIAGMNRIHIADFRRADDAVYFQIAARA